MDIRAFNREAWNRQVEQGNQWTIPVTHEQVEIARCGELKLLLTPTIPVPVDWYPELKGCKVLCLASGGGQQGPLLAAAGAQVTVYDNSPRQLERDGMVAEREGLDITLVEGDMRDLSVFEDETFDLIFHPVSNVFIPDILPVWQESYRVLKEGGRLLAGITNPVQYIFDYETLDKKDELVVANSIPYSDEISLSEERKEQFRLNGDPLEFGHTLDDQIGGQLRAGFILTGFYEDIDPWTVIGRTIPSFIATRAEKPIFGEE